MSIEALMQIAYDKAQHEDKPFAMEYALEQAHPAIRDDILRSIQKHLEDGTEPELMSKSARESWERIKGTDEYVMGTSCRHCGTHTGTHWPNCPHCRH